jgi:hypothetical protein
MELMSTLRVLGSMLAAAVSLLGCSDLYAPDGGVAFFVTPDTLRYQQNLTQPNVELNFHVRNVNPFLVAVSPCAPEVQKETAPDVWETVKPADDCIAEPLPAGTWRPLLAFLGPLAAGRYRLQGSYMIPDSRGVSLTNDRSYNQYSNVFVVIR